MKTLFFLVKVVCTGPEGCTDVANLEPFYQTKQECVVQRDIRKQQARTVKYRCDSKQVPDNSIEGKTVLVGK